jgi:hypothetical protein
VPFVEDFTERSLWQRQRLKSGARFVVNETQLLAVLDILAIGVVGVFIVLVALGE